MSTPPIPPPGPGNPWAPPSPQPGWGLPPGYGQQPPRLNGFALASLLVGLLCLPPLGIVFGVVALVQISKKGEKGKALAIVGLVVSVLMTGVVVLSAERVATVFRDRLASVNELTDVEGELTDFDDMRAGDCFNVPGGDLMDDHPLIYKTDCALVHHGEVTESKPMDPKAPIESAEADLAFEDECWKAQDAYAMDSWALPSYAEMFYFAPSSESWRLGDRRLLCVIGTTEEDQRGSLRQDAGTLKPEQAAFLRAANTVEFVLSRPPDEEAEEALAEHQAWAREVSAALGEEAKVVEGHAALPGMDKAARAQLKEIEAARAEWQRAAQAKTAPEFYKRSGGAAGVMLPETERALRGAYGLSTRIPRWLEEDPDDSGSDSVGRGPSNQSV
ncbi:DUF4190 domain-containing protein [Streptomyces sp. NPDC059385]|uniref:DUF4190 domain-containing protein n=1 Tax=Streptomyces sp. NPDC059385 TaxID=3346817 RepID=UPI00367BED14